MLSPSPSHRRPEELWWDLAKAFVVPVPLTVSELEPHKQRICRPAAGPRWRGPRMENQSKMMRKT